MASSLIIASQRTVAPSADAFALADEFICAMDRMVASKEMTIATRNTYKIGIDKFIDFAAAHRTVDANVIRDWIAALRAKHFKSATINTWLAGVRAFLRWAEGEHRIPFNPATGVKSAKHVGAHTQHVRDSLTDAEVLRVLTLPDATEAGTRDRAYLYLRAYTACRDIELHRARVADLQTKSGRLVLMVRGKGHIESDDFVVVVPEAEAAVRDWLAIRVAMPPGDGALFVSLSDRSHGKRLSLRAIRWLVKKYFLLAGITEQNKTSHSLRHSAITNAIRHGAPIQKAKSMARHANVETTLIYFHEHDRVTDPAEARIRYGQE